MKIKFFLAAALVFLGGALSAQTLSLSGPSTANSGDGFTIIVNGETSNYYVTGVTLDNAASYIPNTISAVSAVYDYSSGLGSGQTSFAVATFAVPGTVATTATLVFDVNVFDLTSGMLSTSTITLNTSVTINPPPADGGYSYSGVGPVNVVLSTWLYRANNTAQARHLYTGSLAEIINLVGTNSEHGYQKNIAVATYDQNGNVTGIKLINVGSGTTSNWVDEGYIGFVFNSPQSGTFTTVALHRLYNVHNNDHFITADANEYSSLVSQGWNDEGILGYVYPSTTTTAPNSNPVYRYNSPHSGHFFTSDINELGTNNPTYTYEGIAFYILTEMQ